MITVTGTTISIPEPALGITIISWLTILGIRHCHKNKMTHPVAEK
jgi:hypothetical protein